MMRALFVFVVSLLSSALAAPAVVWKQESQKQLNKQSHTSYDLTAANLIADSIHHDDSYSLAAVIFLLARREDGSEGLSAMAAAGNLTGVFNKYDDAYAVHHSVSGVDSAAAMVRHAERANPEFRVLRVTLDEFITKMTSSTTAEVSADGIVTTSKKANKRAREIANANVLIVTTERDTCPGKIDDAVVRAVESPSIGNVVLSAIRSTEEVKLERQEEMRRRFEMMKDAGDNYVLARGRRRLEDQNNNNADNGNNNNNDEDLTGVYYVSMTPNIFAGLLFGLLFVVVTWIGISCMGMISGQDVYVSKMPTIGREA